MEGTKKAGLVLLGACFDDELPVWPMVLAHASSFLSVALFTCPFQKVRRLSV